MYSDLNSLDSSAFGINEAVAAGDDEMQTLEDIGDTSHHLNSSNTKLMFIGNHNKRNTESFD